MQFRTSDGVFDAVDGLSYTVEAGRTLAIVGESGCGKSVSSLAVMGLLGPTAQVIRGAVRFRGTDLLGLAPKERRAYAGEHIAMVFQDALAALNPVHSVGYQITEALRTRRGMSRSDARRRAIELLEMVKVPRAATRIRDYPHQFSGGMRQRVMIAVALALDPEVLIADEPTTALDVTVQAQILRLLRRDPEGAAHGSGADHPRPRRGRDGRRRRDGDVRRPRRRAGDDAAGVRRPGPPVHAGAAAGDAPPARRRSDVRASARWPPRRHPRSAAATRRGGGGLPVPPALRRRARGVPHDDTAARRAPGGRTSLCHVATEVLEAAHG